MRKRLLITTLLLPAMLGSKAQNTPASQMERLDRGVIALTTATGGNFVSWRLLGTDDEDHTTFTLKRNGTVVESGLYATCYQDKAGNAGSTYQVIACVNGVGVDTSRVIKPWGQLYRTLTLERPATGSNGGTYSPNDMSVGDVDGDGQYELFVKWDPSNSQDNSKSGITDNVYIDCYKVDYDGTQEEIVNGKSEDGNKSVNCKLLWRVDLGANIRAGAHYTQYLVYDFDGDGRAEMICKTAPGSLDGQGRYVNQAATSDDIRIAANSAVHRNSSGRITGGQEYLTVFRGTTGEAVHTIFYNPNRNMTYGGAANGSVNWGDVDGKNDTGSYGNRGERYLAAVAALDGPGRPASGIFSRGYYGYAFVWAVDFDGSQLKQRWLSAHKSRTDYTVTTYDDSGQSTSQTVTGCRPTSGKGSGTMFANGNHNLSIADVDGDGCDEIVWGSAALDNDGRLLYGTGFGHGDAIHLADHCPDRPGLEVFQIHEESPYGWDLHDARTGEVIHSATGSADNGRGIAAQMDKNVRGSLFWSSNDGAARSTVTGEAVSEKHGTTNFRIFWDGDLQEELLDGNKIDKWNGDGTSRLVTFYDLGGPSSTCNSTKNTPCLQADILGDWREEVILHNGADQIAIYSTTTKTDYRMPTLMHDHTYRMGVAWQQTAYNQPPHLGYYLPDAMKPRLRDQNKELTIEAGQQVTYVIAGRYATMTSLTVSQGPDGKKVSYGVPEGFTMDWDFMTDQTTISGQPTVVGDYVFTVEINGRDGSTVEEQVTIHVVEPTGIGSLQNESTDGTATAIYDLQGRRLANDAAGRRGICVMRRGNKAIKVSR